LFYSIDMIELLLPCRFDTLEYSWLKSTIGIYMFADYYAAKKCQQVYSIVSCAMLSCSLR
jgi:hypothetical protein